MGYFRCVKSVRIRSFSGPHFPAFGLNTERYGVSIRIQSEYGKIRTRKTSNTEIFLVVFTSYDFKLLLSVALPISKFVLPSLACKFNSLNVKSMYESYSTLAIKTPEQRQWRVPGIFYVNFE